LPVDWALITKVPFFSGEIAMSDVTIRVRPNGPLLVEGPFELLDSAGNKFPLDASKPAFALCRCGASANKPFCDGSHKAAGFESDERAPAE
jgi:CDGSH-type Zn-finger protein